jgi:hypothetical protein
MSPIYTPEDSLARYRQTVKDLIKKYGSKHAVPQSEYERASERLRAENVAAKALRDGDNVAKVLRAHFVSQTFINELGFETPAVTQSRRGSRALEEFIDKNPGETVNVPDLMEIADCSEATVRNFIRTHRARFRQAGRGIYEVIDQVAARKEGK